VLLAAGELCCWLLAALLIYHGRPDLLQRAISQGTEEVSTVPEFNLWTIEWNVSRLEQGGRDYWQAPIFYPQPGTFAFSEPQPHTMLLAPLLWCGGSPLAYNVIWLLYLAANGWIVRRMLHGCGLPSGASWLGGAIGFCLPFVSWQAGVLQLTALWAPVLVLWLVAQLRVDRHWLAGLRLGLAFGLCYSVCNYYALFLSLLSPACLVLVWERLREFSLWRQLAVALLVSALWILPVAGPQLYYLRKFESRRTVEAVSLLSAHPRDYLVNRTKPLTWLETTRWGDQRRLGWMLGSGSMLLGLAGVGAITGLIRSERRSWTLFWLLFGLLAFGASLGPPLRWGSFAPYAWLMNWHPGLAAIRSPFRFAVFVQLALLGLAAEGFARMLQVWQRCCQRQPLAENDILIEVPAETPGWLSWWACSLGAIPLFGLPVVMLIQIWPAGLQLTEPAPVSAEQPWIRWLKEELPAKEPILCLPLPQGPEVHFYESTPLWMRAAILHGHPLVNGYSGFFPPAFVELREQLYFGPREGETAADHAARLAIYPPQATRDWLLQNGVRTIVILVPAVPEVVREGLADCELVFVDRVHHRSIYRLPGSHNENMSALRQ
jgi:hypothetical protein